MYQSRLSVADFSRRSFNAWTSMNHISLKKKAGLDVMQSLPLWGHILANARPIFSSQAEWGYHQLGLISCAVLQECSIGPTGPYQVSLVALVKITTMKVKVKHQQVWLSVMVKVLYTLWHHVVTHVVLLVENEHSSIVYWTPGFLAWPLNYDHQPPWIFICTAGFPLSLFDSLYQTNPYF